MIKMDMSVIIAFLTLVSGALGVWISWVTFNRKQRKDSHQEGESRGVMASDLGYIKAGIDDLKQEHREDRARIDRLGERVTRCEESTKQAHKRIDEIHDHIESNN